MYKQINSFVCLMRLDVFDLGYFLFLKKKLLYNQVLLKLQFNKCSLKLINRNLNIYVEKDKDLFKNMLKFFILVQFSCLIQYKFIIIGFYLF